MANQSSTLITGLLLIVLSPFTHAAIWQDAPAVAARDAVKAARVADYGRQLIADETALRDLLATATLTSPAIMSLPMPEGGLRQFSVTPSPVMSPALAAEFPSIQTFKARAVDDARITGRLSISPRGFHAYISQSGDTVLIDPQPEAGDRRYLAYSYRGYSRQFAERRRAYRCAFKPDAGSAMASPLPKSLRLPAATLLARTEGALQVYRLAVAATSEYSQVVGGDVTSVMAEIIVAINRVNEIFERDVGVSFQLVANNSAIIYTSEPDPYSNTNPAALLDENQANLDSVIGSANYDIGHVFSTGGGGLAGLGVVCDSAFKARGETGLPTPTGDAFYIDLVAHELGHQLGANHSFNGTSGECGPNRNAATAFEPGSGITIMGYSGLCGSEDIASNAIAAFHAGSIEEMVNLTRLGTGACSTPGGNSGKSAPTVNAGSDVTIPGGTPFVLRASASDTDGDPLLYSWEQLDAGSATNASSFGLDNGSNALFRSFEPLTVPDRVFPQMPTLLTGSADPAETLPTQSRTLNFRITVRDGLGGVDADDRQVTVDGSKGPFALLQPDTAVTLDSTQNQVIEWNAACTEQAPVNCTTVDISYFTSSNPVEVLLAAAVPNTGSASVNFGSVNASGVRVKIACSDNVFFDIADNDLTLSNAGGAVLGNTGAGGSYNCGTEVDYGSTGNDAEPNDIPAQAQPVTIPFSVIGSIDDSIDFSDYFSFTSTGGAYTIVLSDYGSHDLDLYLFDSDGVSQLGASETATEPVETITIGLPNDNQTYYVLVSGWFTSGLTTSYSLSISKNAPAGGGGGGGGGVLSAGWLVLIPWLILFRVHRQRAGNARS